MISCISIVSVQPSLTFKEGGPLLQRFTNLSIDGACRYIQIGKELKNFQVLYMLSK